MHSIARHLQELEHDGGDERNDLEEDEVDFSMVEQQSEHRSESESVSVPLEEIDSRSVTSASSFPQRTNIIHNREQEGSFQQHRPEASRRIFPYPPKRETPYALYPQADRAWESQYSGSEDEEGQDALLAAGLGPTASSASASNRPPAMGRENQESRWQRLMREVSEEERRDRDRDRAARDRDSDDDEYDDDEGDIDMDDVDDIANEEYEDVGREGRAWNRAVELDGPDSDDADADADAHDDDDEDDDAMEDLQGNRDRMMERLQVLQGRLRELERLPQEQREALLGQGRRVNGQEEPNELLQLINELPMPPLAPGALGVGGEGAAAAGGGVAALQPPPLPMGVQADDFNAFLDNDAALGAEDIQGAEVAMEMRLAIVELLGLEGPMHVMFRNAALLATYCVIFLFALTYCPHRFGMAIIKLLQSKVMTLFWTTEQIDVSMIGRLLHDVEIISKENHTIVYFHDFFYLMTGFMTISSVIFGADLVMSWVTKVISANIIRSIAHQLSQLALMVKIVALLLMRIFVLPMVLGK
jgi:hypothetical protein